MPDNKCPWCGVELSEPGYTFDDCLGEHVQECDAYLAEQGGEA